MTTPEIITQLLKTQTDGWAKENMSVIKAHVDRLFENAPDLAGTIRQNPVTGSSWLNGVDPIAPKSFRHVAHSSLASIFPDLGRRMRRPCPFHRTSGTASSSGGCPTSSRCSLVRGKARITTWSIPPS